MKANHLLLELSMESTPQQVFLAGEVDDVPAVGDFVQRENVAGWAGYVTRRKWTIHENGRTTVRCWLHKDPPR